MARVHSSPLRCLSHACAVHFPLRLPRNCHALAMPVPCLCFICRAFTVPSPCLCHACFHGFSLARVAVLLPCISHAGSLPSFATGLNGLYRAFATSLPCLLECRLPRSWQALPSPYACLAVPMYLTCILQAFKCTCRAFRMPCAITLERPLPSCCHDTRCHVFAMQCFPLPFPFFPKALPMLVTCRYH